MLQRILMNTIWGKAILVMSVTGVLLQMITIFSYKSMKRAAENAGKTKKQWVQILRKRFENYERFGKIGNVEAFVEHYFSRKGILGIPIGFWDKSVFFLSVVSLMTGVTGAFLQYLDGEGVRNVISLLFLGFFSSICLFMVHMMRNSREDKRKIVTALTDFLANGTGVHREKTKEVIKIPSKEEVDALSEAAVTEEEKQILSEILEDYFW